MITKGRWMRVILFFFLFAQFVFPMNTQASDLIAINSRSVNNAYVGNNIIISNIDNIKHLPSIAYNSKHNEYLVTWHTEWAIGTRDIRAQRVSSQGTLIGSEFIVFEHATKDAAQPSVAYDPVNDRYLVTFIFDSTGVGSDWDIYGRIIPWNGPSASLLSFPIVTWTPTSQWNPRVVYAGTQQEFFVVWNNTYPAAILPAYVSGKRIYPDGTFPSSGSDLTLNHASINYINPDVSYNIARNEYLVVWDRVGSSDDIWGVRLRGDAFQLGSGPFSIAAWPDDEMQPSVAACNQINKYLVTWQSDVGTGGSDYAIYGYLVNGDGTLDHVFQIDNTTSPEVEPSVACNWRGNQFMVAYQQRYTNVKYGITARLIYADNSMNEAFVVVPPGTSADRTYPAVAGGRINYLVSWEHQRDGTAYQDIYGKLITPAVIFMPFIKG